VDDTIMSETMPSSDPAGDDVAAVRQLIGPDLTAFVANLSTTRDLEQATEKDDGARQRLRIVLRLADQFRRVNALTLFRAWLREVDVELDKQNPPAGLIRVSPDVCGELPSAAGRYLRSA
jgi:hypothetical protein